MWAGIACMSVCLPFSSDIIERAKKRGPYNIAGCLIFIVLYYALPAELHPYIGIIGGIGVGYSAGYAWQTVFNTFGALHRGRTLWRSRCCRTSNRSQRLWIDLYRIIRQSHE